jgi:DNA-directed RNA polymerase alpha subunit
MRNRVMNFIGKANYTGDLGTYIWSNNLYGKTELIAMIEGYREIQELCTSVSEANEFQDEMGRFIAEAINEKIQRDCVKVKRIFISDLDISLRLLNVLTNAKLYPESGLKVTFLDEISQLTRQKVYWQRNFGTKSKFELEQLMQKYNIKFKGE